MTDTNLAKNKPQAAEEPALIAAALEGDRQAFGRIVSRYQGLLCALAYSAVGDVSHSEDIAQEAFVEAWGKLATLREPHKLKSWLCGILRFKISHFYRKEVRQPTRNADELDERNAGSSDDSRTEEAMIRAQEQAMLWQAIESVPPIYREPLILFYREEQSASEVAEALDITEDAVKQRLSRGRKLTQAKMMHLVETTIAKTKPGAAFTSAVLLAISAAPQPAKAAAIGSAAAKAGSYFESIKTLAFLAPFSGLVGAFFGVRAGLDQSRTARERRRVFKVAGTLILCPLLFVAVLFLIRGWAMHDPVNAGALAIANHTLIIGFIVGYGILLIRMMKGSRRLRAAERQRRPDAFDNPRDEHNGDTNRYVSRLKLLGVPLVQVQLGAPETDDTPVVAWIAGGERAYGLLFAWGALAVAPISVGIYSLGIVSIGAVGFGVLGLGTIGVGLVSFGAVAVGYKAYASLSALGWHSAFSQGISTAHEAAIGTVANAAHTNSEMAAQLASLGTFGQAYLWLLALITVLVIAPAAWYAKRVRHAVRPTRL